MFTAVSDFLPAAALDSASPAYAAIRWIWFASLTALVGAAAFRTVVLPRCNVDPQSASTMTAVASRIAVLAALIDLLSAAARWAAQTIALFGSLSSDAMVLLGTGWGRGLLLQAVTALVVLLALTMLRRWYRLAWGITSLAVLAAAAAPAFSGHAAAAELQPWAVIADTAHVLAAGAWIGTLLVIAAIAIRAARTSDHEAAHLDLAAIVNAFSPLALAAAALLLASGAFSSWIHLRSLAQLVQSVYGRFLLLKLAAVAATAAAGAWNWKRVRPDLGTPPASVRLRSSTRTELAFALIVLLLTAILVATDPPWPG